MMNIVLKDKIKVDKNFIDDLITKGWQESENLQNQIDSIKLDSAVATKTVKLLKDLLTSYYVFTGCLENIGNEPLEAPIEVTELPKIVEQPEVNIPERLIVTPEDVKLAKAPDVNVFSFSDYSSDGMISEPFEYFVDFDEPTGEPLTDDDLYN